jgi:hypothetical protein
MNADRPTMSIGLDQALVALSCTDVISDIAVDSGLLVNGSSGPPHSDGLNDELTG